MATKKKEQESPQDILQAYLDASLQSRASVIPGFGEEVTKSVRWQAVKLSKDGFKIGHTDEYKGTEVVDLSGSEFFNRKRRTGILADILSANLPTEKTPFNDIIAAKGINPDTSVVVYVSDASPRSISVPMTFNTGALEKFQAAQKKREEALYHLSSQQGDRKQAERELTRANASLQVLGSTFQHRFSLPENIQDSLDAVGLDPQKLVQFTNIEYPSVRNIDYVPPHGYVFDLGDKKLVARLKAETEKLQAAAENPAKGKHTAAEDARSDDRKRGNGRA